MLASWADTFVLHITDEENKLMNPDPVDKCLHGVYQEDCEKSTATAKKCDDGGGGGGQLLLCPTEDSVKYKMVRVSLESLNFFLVEAETACNIQVCEIISFFQAFQNNYEECGMRWHETIKPVLRGMIRAY